MTEREPWLGHRDLCSLQWSDECDCLPCCIPDEDGGVLGHHHADGDTIACRPTRCPGCRLCPLPEDSE